MKKMQWGLAVLLLVIGLVSCDKAEKGQQEENHTGAIDTEMAEISGTKTTETLSEDGTLPEDGKQEKILIAYFTWAENTVPDDMDTITSASVQTPGNVTVLASWIAEETGGELFSI